MTVIGGVAPLLARSAFGVLTPPISSLSPPLFFNTVLRRRHLRKRALVASMQGVSTFDRITGMTAIGGVAPLLARSAFNDSAYFAYDLYCLRLLPLSMILRLHPPPTAPPPIPPQLHHLP